MSIYNQAKEFFNRQIEPPSSQDSEDVRRRRLLNIILSGLILASIFTLLGSMLTVVIGITSLAKPGIQQIFISGFMLLGGSLAFYFLNRNQSVPSWFTTGLFLTLLMILFSFTDSPTELAGGRSLFVFFLPVIMASMLMRPFVSFVFAMFSAIEVFVLGNIGNIPLNISAIVGFFLIALIAWLSSRSLVDALRDLRAINTELDQRVADRTHELSEALTREYAETGRRQAILEGIGDGVIVLNNDNQIIMANPAIGRLLEMSVEQIANHKFDDILQSPILSDEDRNTLVQVINTSDTAMSPVRIHWDKKTLSVKAAPVMNANGQAIGNVAVLRDFTREAEVEEMKNTFVAMVSHELRTPLNAILGYSEMLRDAVYGPVNKKQSNAADRILKNSRRLFDIVSDLLDKAQIEAGHLALHYEEFKTIDLVENLHSVMDKIASDKGLELNAVVAPEMPEMLKGDSQRLQQVMVNLANNAVKFTEKGGIYVRIYRVTEEHWAFDVTDTGPGIALEDQKYIFDPFRQVDGTVTRSHGGIGLGLAIVKRIIDLMGGRVFVQSSLGHGTMFTVVLPLQPQEKEE